MRGAGVARSRSRLRLWLRLLRATRFVEGELRERMRREFDATLPRFDVLAALDRAPGGMTMSELSRALMVSNGNVTGIVDRLTAGGLVSRSQAVGDRRTVMVRLTKKGQRDFESMAAVHEGWVDELLDGFNEGEADALSETLGTLEKGRVNP